MPQNLFDNDLCNIKQLQKYSLIYVLVLEKFIITTVQNLSSQCTCATVSAVILSLKDACTRENERGKMVVC